MKRIASRTIASLLFGGALLFSGAASAQDAYKWWPFDVINRDTGKISTYEPLEKASKAWHVCILFPHVKDIYWVSVAYGVMEEARRLGIKATLLEAGGYSNLVKQIAQYDDCVSLGADAIVLSVVSEAGLANKIKEGHDKKIPQVALINPVSNAPVDAKIFVDYGDQAAFAAKYLVERYKGRETVNAVIFPGPPGADWANDAAKGFKEAVAGSNINILEEKYEDTGKATQLPLVEDTLQAHDNVNLLFGVPSMTSVAVEALSEAGRDNIDVMAYIVDQQAARDTAAGKILGFVSESPVVQGSIAIDTAVRLLEKADVTKNMAPQTVLVTKDNIGTIDLRSGLAPEGWQLVTKVD
ncbi:MAG: TMAO reductase system periplasmic protein TorT [Parvibaculaceae bacterium]